MFEQGYAAFCQLERHKECALQQFYGWDLECECPCHSDLDNLIAL